MECSFALTAQLCTAVLEYTWRLSVLRSLTPTGHGNKYVRCSLEEMQMQLVMSSTYKHLKKELVILSEKLVCV